MLSYKAFTEFDLSRVGRSKNTRKWYQRMLRPLGDSLRDVEIKDVTVLSPHRWHQFLENHPVQNLINKLNFLATFKGETKKEN